MKVKVFCTKMFEQKVSRFIFPSRPKVAEWLTLTHSNQFLVRHMTIGSVFQRHKYIYLRALCDWGFGVRFDVHYAAGDVGWDWMRTMRLTMLPCCCQTQSVAWQQEASRRARSTLQVSHYLPRCWRLRCSTPAVSRLTTYQHRHLK